MVVPDAVPPGRRTLVALFAAALALRIAAVMVSGPSRNEFGDAAAYVRTARVLIDTGTYPADVDPLPVFRAPGYPVFLALSTLGHPEATALDKLWNAVLGAFSVVMLALLARRMLGSRRAAVLAGGIAAVHPSFIVLSIDVKSEALFVLCLLGAAHLLLKGHDDSRGSWACWGGVLLGLAILTRPSALVFLPLLPFLALDLRGEARRRVPSLAIAACLLVVGPWTVRNALVHRAWLPVNDQMGLVLYQGNSEMNERYYRLRTRSEYEAWTRYVSAEIENGSIHALAGPPGTNPGVRSRALARAAIDWMRQDPGRTLSLLLHKAADWLRPWPSPFRWSRPVVIAVGGYNTLLGIAAVFGLYWAPRGLTVAALVVFVTTMAIHVLLLTIWRYRIVYWDPVLVIYASYGIARSSARAPGAVPSSGGRP
jgi:4-amino-4-deoxy-L-arabinose transferase-like glycosyltransferase